MIRCATLRQAAALCVIEVRLDDAGRCARLSYIVKASPKPVMATCRRAGKGGALTAASARLDLLRAPRTSAAWVDVEEDGRRRRRKARRRGADVRSCVRRFRTARTTSCLLEAPADAAKLVALRSCDPDVVRLLDPSAVAAARRARFELAVLALRRRGRDRSSRTRRCGRADSSRRQIPTVHTTATACASSVCAAARRSSC
jgi:3-dehydroquinate dehydratase